MILKKLLDRAEHKNKTTKRNPGRPAQSEEVDTNHMLNMALRTFAKYGFFGASIKLLAQDAGITPALFYYHFLNKEEIWKASIKRVSSNLSELMLSTDNLLKEADPLSYLKAVNRQFIFFSAKHPEFHQIISYEMANPSSRADWLLENILRPLHEKIGIRLTKLIEKEIIKDISIPHFLSLSIGAANIFFTQGHLIQNLYGIDVFDDKEIQRHADICNEVIFNGIIKYHDN